MGGGRKLEGTLAGKRLVSTLMGITMQSHNTPQRNALHQPP